MTGNAGADPPFEVSEDVRAAALRLKKIPWDEPGFSERMLREHLSQEHDAASARTEIVEAQVQWIVRRLLPRRRSRVLDLGCGPGFHTERIARAGHWCVGIDFSPASVAHARESAARENLSCEYICADVRTTEYDGPFDLAVMLSGEINMFERSDAENVLRKVRTALRGDGAILLEVQAPRAIERRGQRPPLSYSTKAGLFSEEPHSVIQEFKWDETDRSAHVSYFVLDAATAVVTPYGETAFAYGENELRNLLSRVGFAEAIRDYVFPMARGDERMALIARLTSRA